MVQRKGVNVPSLQNAKVLVTGAGGFLARHTIPRLLDTGAEVIGLDVRNGLDGPNLREMKVRVKLVEGDISKYPDLEKIDDSCDYVVHLAAIAAPIQCEQNPDRAFLTNVQGTFNVLKLAAKKKAKKILFSSSAHVYGISPKYMPTDENHPLALLDTYCYDDQTEILTDGGWKRVTELDGTELVMQLNREKWTAEMVKPIMYYKKHYEGPIFLYEGKSNFAVTPNHRFWAAPSRRPKFDLIPIEEMMRYCRAFLSGEVRWTGERAEEYTLEEYVAMRGRNHAQRYVVAVRRLEIEPWLTFLGWYVSEGSTSRERYVRMTQKKEEFTKEIEDCIKTLGWRPSIIENKEKNALEFCIGSVQLYQWIHDNCYVSDNQSSYTKKVPEFVKQLSPDLIEIFLSAYWKGDGGRAGAKRGRTWTTYSERLANDIQELILKTGKVATLTRRIDKRLKIPFWVVYERRRGVLEIKTTKIRKIDYEGLVGCVEVPSHVVLVRRNGKVMWCGNTSTKILGESLCQLFYSNHHLAYVTTRLFNGYGPGQNTDYFIPAMIGKAKSGKIELRGRHITKDFVFVEDVGDAFVKALMSDYVGEINIGSGNQTTLEYVASYIAKALGAELSFSKVDPSGPTHMQCDPTRALKILGWKAMTPIEKGLDRTIAASK